MPVRVLTERDVHALLPMDECVDVMAEALATLARGDAVLPLRAIMRAPEDGGLLGVMPAWLGLPRCLGLKAITVMPRNQGTPWETHQGAVLLFETDHGRLLAVVDASSITAIRTAAVSGAATRALARPEASDLAILGSGTQAGSHLAAMRAVRPLRRVRVWSRSPDRSRSFAEREGARHGLAVEPVASVREAVEGADMICTTTASREPLLRGDWIAAGTHVNAVGACLPTTRELDGEAMRRARLYVDRRESALAEAGDFLIPRGEGLFGDGHILGELGEVLIGRVEGRRSPADVTVFKSLGIAIEDLAAAHHVWRKAEARDSGVSVDLGGRRT